MIKTFTIESGQRPTEEQLEEMFGKIESLKLVTRGDKYVIVRRDDVDGNRAYISGKWQKNI